jgi:hypothetical protein
MRLEAHVLLKLTAITLLVVALVVLDLVLTGGDVLAVGQYGRHGSS